MKIIGIELHAPNRSELKALAMFSLSCIVIFLLLANFAKIPIATLVPFFLGAISGSLGSACGSSIQEHGIRGAILLIGFGIAMYVLYFSLSYLIRLF